MPQRSKKCQDEKTTLPYDEPELSMASREDEHSNYMADQDQSSSQFPLPYGIGVSACWDGFEVTGNQWGYEVSLFSVRVSNMVPNLVDMGSGLLSFSSDIKKAAAKLISQSAVVVNSTPVSKVMIPFMTLVAGTLALEGGGGYSSRSNFSPGKTEYFEFNGTDYRVQIDRWAEQYGYEESFSDAINQLESGQCNVTVSQEIPRSIDLIRSFYDTSGGNDAVVTQLAQGTNQPLQDAVQNCVISLLQNATDLGKDNYDSFSAKDITIIVLTISTLFCAGVYSIHFEAVNQSLLTLVRHFCFGENNEGNDTILGLQSIEIEAEERELLAYAEQNDDSLIEMASVKVEVEEREKTNDERLEDIGIDKHDDCVPKRFICVLSQGIMTDPVLVSSGESYEREYIESWIQSCRGREITCPITRENINKDVFPNNDLRREIKEFVEYKEAEYAANNKGSENESESTDQDTKQKAPTPLHSIFSDPNMQVSNEEGEEVADDETQVAESENKNTL